MGQRVNVIVAMMSFAYAVTVSATERSNWITPMQCGELKARISISCSKAKISGDLNNCTMPQKLEFLSKENAVLKVLSAPVFQQKEIAEFKKSQTYGKMFAHTWTCVKHEGAPYLYISYSASIGNNPFGEYEEYYSKHGDRVISDKTIRTLDRLKDEIDGANRTNFIKSTLTE